MHAHVFQHVPYEGLGSIADWLATRDARISWTRWFDSGAASPESFGGTDLLVVLGGPMSANDVLPWLAAERDAIRRAIDSGTAVLGICLGAQQIARVLGARVFVGADPEIGWWPLRAAPGASGPFADLFFSPIDAFHWHGETFEIPEGAEHLAASDACAVQAFSFGNRVLGLQFHLETISQSVADLVAHSDDHLKPGRFIQSAGEMLADPARFAAANRIMARVLERLAKKQQ
jgi:GMP synthase-like glutamine amidotransferase